MKPRPCFLFFYGPHRHPRYPQKPTRKKSQVLRKEWLDIDKKCYVFFVASLSEVISVCFASFIFCKFVCVCFVFLTLVALGYEFGILSINCFFLLPRIQSSPPGCYNFLGVGIPINLSFAPVTVNGGEPKALSLRIQTPP